MRLYLAVGHGMEPNGTYDPGAVAIGGHPQEHEIAHAVVEAAAASLSASGVDFYFEHDSGRSHDPDFIGSTAAVNSGDYALAVEVHFDANNAPGGGFGIYANETSRGKVLAQTCANAWGQAGLAQRPNYADVRGLYFLTHTKCPALIWECDTTRPHDNATLVKMGRTLAKGICAYMGVPYRESGPAPSPAPLPTPQVVDWRMVDAISARACGIDSDGCYVLQIDGGVAAMHGAPFRGAFPGLPPDQRRDISPHYRITAREDHQPGYMTWTVAGGKFSF